MDLPEHRVWKLLLETLLALEYIHSKQIIHSDMKPENILLVGKDYDVRVGDFGVSYSQL